MIIVKNRELLIPNHERYIGTTYDNESEMRLFQIPRFSQRGVDLAALTFRLDLKYANNAADTVILTKEVTDLYIYATWEITNSQLQVPGTVYIGIRATDNEATVKWTSFPAAIYVDRHLNTPGNYTGDLAEIEQMEQDHQYMLGVVDELRENLDYRQDAEAWAVGTRLGEEVPETDDTYHNNSKYYSEQASSSAADASSSKTAAAASASQAATTVTTLSAQFDNAISALTVDSEVQDIRVGADGTAYTTAGSAVRNQVNDLKSAIDVSRNDMKVLGNNMLITNRLNWEQGNIQDGVPSDEYKEYRVRTKDYLKSNEIAKLYVDRSTKEWRTFIFYYDSSKTYQTNATTLRSNITINSDYPFFKLVAIDNTNDSYYNAIIPSEVWACYSAQSNSEIKNEIDAINDTLHDVSGKTNSMPAYTEMFSEYGLKCYPIEFENGRINTSTGEDYADDDDRRPYRVRSIGYLSTDISYVIDLRKKAYQVFVYYYNASKVFQEATSAITRNKIAIDKNYAYFRLVILNYDGSSYTNNITPDECYQNIFVGNDSAFTELTKYNIPQYYDTQLETVKAAIISHNGIVGKDGASFVFITDLHWANNRKHSPALIKYVIDNNMINRVVLGGDYLTSHDTKAEAVTSLDSCMKSFFNLCGDVFPIFGNHDENSVSAGVDPDKNLTDGEAYSLINQWMSNDVVYGSNYFDFYWDDNKNNTRYVMIDTGAQNIDHNGEIKEETFTWLASVLNTDKNIIVFAHWLFTPTTWNQPLVDHVLTGNYTSYAQRLFTMLDNANSSGAKVQAIITGHVHCDYNASTTGGIPIVWTDTDGMGAYGDYSATTGTVSEQCIDVYSIDYTSKTIYCDRIGRGVSREISY